MIRLEDVFLSFSGEPLFEKVTFTLQAGEKCGFVGRNGSGKSTLFRLITGEIEPDRGVVEVPRSYRIGYLRQHIRFTQPTLLKEAALGLPLEEVDQTYKAEKILFGLGFSQKDLDRNPSEFSGGYHLRLHLAKVLISEPNCLLLDEPTNYLDILSIRWLERFLQRWQGECILISHDREFMDAVSTHTMGIHREKVRKIRGSSIDFFEQIVAEEQVYERSRIKAEKKRSEMTGFIERFGAKATKATQAQARLKMLSRQPILEKLNALAHLSFRFCEAPFSGKKLAEVKDLYFSYTDMPLICGPSLEIQKGQRIGIIGKNGRGKSTFLRLLAKDIVPNQGTVWHSENVCMGYFGQTHISCLNPDHTIEEEIGLSNPDLNITQIKSIAGAMLFGGVRSQKKISVLSGGEKSRVLLAKIMAHPCNLLLLDEPTHHLDIESVEALIDALEDFDGTVVIVTHSELILRRLKLDQILVCEENAQTSFLGDYDLFLEKVGWREESVEKPTVEKKEKVVSHVVKKTNPYKAKECEEKIIALEQEQAVAQALIEKGEFSVEILHAMEERQKQIDRLYDDLGRFI